MSSRIRGLWFTVGLNASALILNLAIAINSFNTGNWLGFLNLFSAILSGVVIKLIFGRIKKAKIEEKERVIDILSGKVAHYG